MLPIKRSIATCILMSVTALASGPRERLVHLQPAELQAIQPKLDPSLLPSGATQVAIEKEQTFKLIQKNAPDTTLVPVHFNLSADTSTGRKASDGCGAYLLTVGSPVTFVRFKAVIERWITPSEHCSGGVEAVGADIPRKDASVADFILIYKVNTSDGIEHRFALFRWYIFSNTYIDRSYVVNTLMDSAHPPTTIRGVLRILGDRSN